MKKKFSPFFYFLVFFVLPIMAQNQKQIDSLEIAIPTIINDSAKLDAINDLCRYIVDVNPDKAIGFAKQSLAIALEKNFQYYQAVAYNNIGNGYYNLADYKTCLDYYIKGLRIQENIKNKKGILSSSGAIGNVYIGLAKYDEALKYFERALKIGKEIGNKNGVASCLISIGTIYSNKKDFKKSLDYYFKSLEIFQEVNNEDAIATNYNNIADTYLELKNYPQSLIYITKASALYEKIGNVYGQSLALNNIGDYYFAVGDADKALQFYNRGLEKGKQIVANEHIIQSFKGISRSYKKLGNYKQALVYHELFQELNDSIYNVESSNQIAEMQARFDSKKQEQEINLLTKDKKIKEDELSRQTLISRAIICVGVLLLLLVIMAVRGNNQKKLANRELGVKNEKIELAYNIIEDQHKDIIDSINYAKRIQEAILPPETVIKKSLPQSFVLYLPKDVVSGDFYWVEPWGTKILFAAVDCTGHGVPGALMSIVGYNLLAKAVNELGLSKPSLILNSLSKGIGKTLRQTGSDSEVKDGMDIALCALDLKTYMLEYAGAYNPLYIIRNGKLLETHSDKIPIGTYLEGEVKNYVNHEMQLEKGDTIYIFTDGYADQFGGEKGKKFKYKSLQQLFISIEGMPMDEQRVILEKTIIDWKGSLEQVDDILIMGVRV
ncbi:MAG: tetratricopeptide repeat protein [Bacteroidetes bacterium]|nr:tetratricopeptide repeat protein [Bacteroidota bacterium]